MVSLNAADVNKLDTGRRKLLLIDDDPVFCTLIRTVACSAGYDVDHFHSLEEMGSFARISEYKLALLDYDLGVMNGLEIAEYVDVFFQEIPAILISSHDQTQLPTKTWPKCIKSFLSKADGPYRILKEARAYIESERALQVI